MLFLKNNYSKFYVLGMAIPLLFVLDYFVLQVIGIEFLGVSLTIVKASFFINILLMTYAILFRMKDIKEETAARKTEMEIFLIVYFCAGCRANPTIMFSINSRFKG